VHDILIPQEREMDDFFTRWISPLLVAIPLAVIIYIPLVIFIETANWIERRIKSVLKELKEN
jgi:uncharacterized membrane protein